MQSTPKYGKIGCKSDLIGSFFSPRRPVYFWDHHPNYVRNYTMGLSENREWPQFHWVIYIYIYIYTCIIHLQKSTVYVYIYIYREREYIYIYTHNHDRLHRICTFSTLRVWTEKQIFGVTIFWVEFWRAQTEPKQIP